MAPISRTVALLALVGGCVAAPPKLPLQPSANASARPVAANVRSDLDRQWIDQNGELKWPPADGFAMPPQFVVLPPGVLIDRFGGDGGRFFSPKGAAYATRALPYVCERLPYTVYRVASPLPAWAGKAAPWFDEPGGATQFQTDAPAAALMGDHVIEPARLAGGSRAQQAGGSRAQQAPPC
ncbi:MAG: TNT domain-containing protein [Acetobacteraceae bacterium]|nr:TNT domain-containing protein [Acetobacteraceae bacterium]